MKLKIVANRAVFGGRCTKSITLNRNYEPSGKSCDEWCTTDYKEDGWWSLTCELSDSKLCELEFKTNDSERTLEPIKGLIWINDSIAEDFQFSAIEL